MSPGPPHQSLTHQFHATFDLDYSRFVTDVDTRVKVTQKIASAAGDGDATRMFATRIEHGSVKYSWTNDTLNVRPCPVAQLARIADAMYEKDGRLKADFLGELRPYVLTDLSTELSDSCAGKEREIHPSFVSDDDAKPVVTKVKAGGDYMFYMIIGLILAAAVILVAVFLAFLLFCRKRRKGKMKDAREQPRKGCPIIFADELKQQEDLLQYGFIFLLKFS